MTIPTEVIMRMATLGLSEAQAQAVADMMTAVESATAATFEATIEASKEKGRERWRKWKSALGLSRGDWVELAGAVLERDEHTCAYCGGVATEADHIVPLSQGGSNDLTNLVAACRACNGGKSGRTPAQWRGGAA